MAFSDMRASGRFRVSFTAQPRRTYRFVVSARDAKKSLGGFGTWMIGGLLDPAVDEDAGALMVQSVKTTRP